MKNNWKRVGNKSAMAFYYDDEVRYIIRSGHSNSSGEQLFLVVSENAYRIFDEPVLRTKEELIEIFDIKVWDI